MTVLFPTEVDKVVPAFIKAVAAIQEPGKAGKAEVRGRAGYSYMTLGDLLAAVRKAFAAQQLAAVQTNTYTDGAIEVVTLVLHESGQMLVTPTLAIRCAADAQSIGSASTYAKRYQLAALVGVVGSDDDDGQQARTASHPSQPPDARPTPPPRPPQLDGTPAGPPRDHTQGSIAPGTVSVKSGRAMWALLRETKMDDDSIRGWVGEVLGIEPDWHTYPTADGETRPNTLSQQQVSTIIRRLRANAAQAGDTTPQE